MRLVRGTWSLPALLAGLIVLSTAGPASAVVADVPQTPFWDVPVAGPTVWRILQIGNTVYVAGTFPGNLAAVDATTGQQIPWNPGLNSTVYALATDGAGHLWVGGNFTTPAKRLVEYDLLLDAVSGQLDLPGSIDPAFGAKADKAVRSLALGAGVLYAGGAFGRLDGIARKFVGAVNATTGAFLARFSPPALGKQVRSVAVDALGRIWVGGYFQVALGDPADIVTVLDPATGAINPMCKPKVKIPSLQVSKFIPAMLNFDVSNPSTVYAAQSGRFNHFIQYDTATCRVNWLRKFDGDPESTAVVGDTAYVGGHFIFEHPGKGETRHGDPANGDVERRRLAAYALNGDLLPWNPGAANDVRAMANCGGRLCIGGDFMFTGGKPAGHFAVYPAIS